MLHQGLLLKRLNNEKDKLFFFLLNLNDLKQYLYKLK